MRSADLFERRARSRSRSIRAGPLAASALAHALLLLALLRWYHPAPPPATRRAPPAPEVLLVELPPLEPDPSSPRRAANAPAAANPVRSPGRSAVAPRPAPRPGDPLAPAETGDVASGGGSTSSSREDGASTLRARAWDPRLYVRSDLLEPAPERPLHERLVADAVAAIRAEPERAAEAARGSRARRQATVLGRRLTVFGDSAAAGFRDEAIELRRDVQTLPVDGPLWERLQMSRQRDTFVRDSILRARARATRERKAKEAEGGSRP